MDGGKMSKINIILRDILFFMLLLVLAREALNMAIVQQNEKNKLSKSSPVRELDPKFLKSIKEARKKADRALETAKNSGISGNIQEIEEIISEINDIEEKYTKNSPATFVLGPIGATAIVLKENKLASQLAEVNEKIEALA